MKGINANSERQVASWLGVLIVVAASNCFGQTVTNALPASLSPVQFQASTITTKPGETNSVIISVTAFKQVTTVQFTLQWDPTILDFLVVTNFGLAGLGGGNFGTILTLNGRLTFSWDDPSGVGVTLPDGTTIYSVVFKTKGLAGSSTVIIFTDQPTLREVTVNALKAGFASQNGLVTVLGDELLIPHIMILPSVAGQFALRIEGPTGRNYTLQVTSDLAIWRDLLSTNPAAIPWTYIQTNANANRAFYRVQVR